MRISHALPLPPWSDFVHPNHAPTNLLKKFHANDFEGPVQWLWRPSIYCKHLRPPLISVLYPPLKSVGFHSPSH